MKVRGLKLSQQKLIQTFCVKLALTYIQTSELCGIHIRNLSKNPESCNCVLLLEELFEPIIIKTQEWMLI